MTEPKFTAIVLAAGQGQRMKSPLPKVLHPVAGEPMVARTVRALREAGAHEVRVVLGHGAKMVRQVVEPLGGVCFLQREQRGTADAVKSAQIENIEGLVLILNGDHPLITAGHIRDILKEFSEQKSALAVVTSVLKKPGSLGRVVRHHGAVRAIVEVADASQDTLKINEVNTGVYVTTAEFLSEYLPRIQSQNAQGEFYLTELVSLAIEEGEKVHAIRAAREVGFGVNSQEELARATRFVFRKKCQELLAQGVMVMDPKSTYVEESVQVGAGTVLYPNVFLKGETVIGSFCVLEPQSFVSNSEIEDGVYVKAGTYIEESRVSQNCTLGPYARLRPKTTLDQEVQIGNFVELKNTKMGARSKAGHLSYLGDAEVGQGTNIGCGTITCNYAVDRKKYRTLIGDEVFVGSDTQFIAPVAIGRQAVIGSGSTITKDVPAGALAVARGRQIIKENYVSQKIETTPPDPVEVSGGDEE